VLVAEDNPENQKVARLMLERMGCRVDTVANGKEAVEMAQRIAYDIVFMDCQMPEMDGYEATQEIRRREAGARQVPIVALTAHAMEGDRQKCLQAGMDDYVSKPVRREAIREVLERRMRLPRGLAPKSVQPASLQTVTEDVDPEFFANLRSLREEAGDEWVASLVTSFVQHTGEKIASLRQALQSRDLAGAKVLAHDLKGSCATLEAMSIARACGELEAKVGSNSFAEIPSLVELLERLFRRLEDTLARGLDR
jgi:CheY-like chemotaxis protein